MFGSKHSDVYNGAQKQETVTANLPFLRRSLCNQGQKILDLLRLRRSMVDTYYRCYRETTQIAIFPGSRKKTKVSDEVRFDKLSHLIGKAKQRRCAEYAKTTLYFCEKRNVALHSECFKEFHEVIDLQNNSRKKNFFLAVYFVTF